MFVCLYMHICAYIYYLCISVFLSVSMSVCICGFECQYHSFICLMLLRIQRVMSTWRDKASWWWMDVSGRESTGAVWSEVSAAHHPPFFPVLSHPVIRVTVRTCLAPIGHANNSFNNPGPCNISLLFVPQCHAKSPAMEKQLHCRKDGMTGWTLSGYVCVCVCPCFCIRQTDHKFYPAFELRFVCPCESFLCVHVWLRVCFNSVVSVDLRSCLCAHLFLWLCLCYRLTHRLHVNLLLCVMRYIMPFLFRQSVQLLGWCKHKHVH